MIDLLIRNGSIVSGDGRREADIAIRDGSIAAIGELSNLEAHEVIDASGLHVLPGAIDTQVHFREPGLTHKEDLESGTRAAIMGGVTTVFEMPNTDPPTTTREALEDKLSRADGRTWCDHAFFVGASAENVGRLADLELQPGSPGIKIFMGSSTGSLLIPDDDTLREVLRNGRHRCAIHAEDEFRLRERKALVGEAPQPEDHPFLRDAETAALATRRLIELVAETGRPLHILHISTAEEVRLIAQAKERGLPITAEVTPQHLWFAGPEDYRIQGTHVQMNPPIRDDSHRRRLRDGLRAGVFDVFGSDHAPHTLEEKSRPYPASPSGMPGVQTFVPALVTLAADGLLDLETLVRMACERPTELYGIRAKGFLREGYDADLTLLDPFRRRSITPEWLQSKCGWSPYEGLDLAGIPEYVILRGTVLVRNGKLAGSPIGRPVRFLWK
ncbi:MAG TPA: dihydroorotase [Fimbriimonadaceae bacterium]|nr:dihydroorotase [Fimbriimonadaceae bacterium]